MTKLRSGFIRSHRRLIIASSVLVLISLLIAGKLIYDRVVINEMRSLANAAQPIKTMSNQRDYIVGPSMFCIGDEPCPMFDRTWKVNEPMDKNTFSNLTRNTNAAVSIDGTCERSPNAGGSTILCSSSYSDNGYRVKVTYSSNSEDRTNDTTLLRIQRDD